MVCAVSNLGSNYVFWLEELIGIGCGLNAKGVRCLVFGVVICNCSLVCVWKWGMCSLFGCYGNLVVGGWGWLMGWENAMGEEWLRGLRRGCCW